MRLKTSTAPVTQSEKLTLSAKNNQGLFVPEIKEHFKN